MKQMPSKLPLTLVILLLFGSVAASLANAEAPRERKLIDSDWRFHLGDVRGAEDVRFDDADWQPIGLPHSFGIPYFGDSKFYVGYGWYRRHLAIGPIAPGRRYAIEFEAAFQDAEIFVNGRRVGEHLGGYTGFSFDITGALHTGDNLVAVRLNNLWNAQLNPRAGEHNFNGGIYRNVYLVSTSVLHVDWYGTFVTTPGLSKDGSPVRVATDVKNESNREVRFALVSDVLDAAGHTVASAHSEESIAADITKTFEQTTLFISKPALWSPTHPILYSVRTRIYAGSRLLDEYMTSFGFRWIQWTADKGLFLNGEHYYFHGADVHQDHAG